MAPQSPEKLYIDFPLLEYLRTIAAQGIRRGQRGGGMLVGRDNRVEYIHPDDGDRDSLEEYLQSHGIDRYQPHTYFLGGYTFAREYLTFYTDHFPSPYLVVFYEFLGRIGEHVFKGQLEDSTSIVPNYINFSTISWAIADDASNPEASPYLGTTSPASVSSLQARRPIASPALPLSSSHLPSHTPQRYGQALGTLLGVGTEVDERVTLGEIQRRNGLYIIGAQGSGKSTLLLNLILQDIKAGHGICVIDPHGDLLNDVLLRLPSRANDVILLDPADYDFPFGLNLLACANPSDRRAVAQTYGQSMQIFEKLWGDNGLYREQSWGAQLEQVLGNSILTLIYNQAYTPLSYTLAEVPLLLEDNEFRNALVANVPDRDVLRFWQHTYNPMNPRDQREYRGSTIRRINKFLRNPIVRNIIAQSRPTISVDAIMEEGKILLASLPEGAVGDEAVSLLGSILVSQLRSAALDRTTRRDFRIYGDEYWYYATEDFSRLLVEGRKFGIGSTIAHQHLSQLSNERDRDAALSTPNKVVFHLSAQEDAEILAGQFDTTPPPSTEVRYQGVLVNTPNPVEYLLAHGHADPTMQEFTRMLSILKSDTLDRSAEQISRSQGRSSGSSGKLGYFSLTSTSSGSSYGESKSFDATTKRAEDARTALDHINIYLCNAMSGVHTGNSEALANAVKRFVPEATPEFFEQVAAIIGEQPIQVETQHQPIPGPQLSSQEVRDRIANQLRHLPSWHAWCKVQQPGDHGIGIAVREYRITTIAPSRVDAKTAEPHVQTIRERSRAYSTRRREEVEAEIEGRQQLWPHSAGRPQEQPGRMQQPQGRRKEPVE